MPYETGINGNSVAWQLYQIKQAQQDAARAYRFSVVCLEVFSLRNAVDWQLRAALRYADARLMLQELR